MVFRWRPRAAGRRARTENEREVVTMARAHFRTAVVIRPGPRPGTCSVSLCRFDRGRWVPYRGPVYLNEEAVRALRDAVGRARIMGGDDSA